MTHSATRPLVVLGSINLDIIATAERLPAPGETIGGAALSHQPGGKGANQAVAAAQLSGTSRLVSAVGDDDAGRQMLAALSAAGVGTAAVAVSGQPTGTALIVVDADGENQIVVAPGANSEVSLGALELSAEDTLLCQLEIGLEPVLDAARKHPGFFALNAAPAMELPAELVERCDLVIVNESEYQEIPGLKDARMVAVTYGGAGSELYRDGELTARAEGLKVPVVSTVGAGDAFCAALTLALRAGYADEAALKLANAVGADAVGQSASQPKLKRLAEYAT